MIEYFILLKKELKSITKEKTIMLAIIIQFFIASLSSVLLVGIMSFYNPESIGQSTQIRIDVGIVGNTNSPLIHFLKQKGLQVIPFSDVSNAEESFKSGYVDTIIFIPETNAGVLDLKLVLPEMDAMETVILMVLQEPFKKYENYLREANGIQLNYKDIQGKPHTTYEFLYTLIVPILMLFPAFIAGSIVIDAITEEIENKTFDTLRAAPVSLSSIFTSKISAAVITSAIQCFMWIILLGFNQFAINNIGLIVLVSVIIAASMSLGASMIALYFREREKAQFMYSVILIVATGLSFLLDPSPISLITRLATGDPHIGIIHVMMYLILLVILCLLLPIVIRKSILTKN